MESPKGRQLHAQAVSALEHEQNYERALKLADEALASYEADNDLLGASELHGARSNIHAHMGNMEAALKDAKEAVAKAEKSGLAEALSRPYFDLGKRYLGIEDYQNAVINLENALNSPIPARHDRPAVKADMEVHLAYAKYMSGDKSTVSMMNQAISKLEEAGEAKYEKDVWLSGAHMRAAEMLWSDSPNQARDHLQKAKIIIDANPDLIIRLDQWKKLNEKLAF